ncbi:hypothetical protein [Sphingomonas molluscorum]|uniref:hypothetical protein n=1 Tax=Sphingomonas molluscorum TaxID=418184 RepID=UPI0031DB02F2
MPIQAEHRWLYPIDWPELSKLIRFGRAKGCCEHCGRPHGARVFHLGDGRWWDGERRRWRDGRGRIVRVSVAELAAIVRVTRVFIACAHLNHDPTDNAPRNLAALCQRCHMIHDAAEHRRRRWLNAYRRRALGDLLARLGDAWIAGVPRGTPTPSAVLAAPGHRTGAASGPAGAARATVMRGMAVAPAAR